MAADGYVGRRGRERAVEHSSADADPRADRAASTDRAARADEDPLATRYLDAILSGDLDAITASDCAEWRLPTELRLHPVGPGAAPRSGAAAPVRGRDSVHDRDSAGVGRHPGAAHKDRVK